jgi:hypothetical protein
MLLCFIPFINGCKKDYIVDSIVSDVNVIFIDGGKRDLAIQTITFENNVKLIIRGYFNDLQPLGKGVHVKVYRDFNQQYAFEYPDINKKSLRK